MKTIHLSPKLMTPETMEYLEKHNAIFRLTPSNAKYRLEVGGNEGKGSHLYRSDIAYGGHSLVNVAINNDTFVNFGTHPDNEDFLLLGGIGEKPMYLLIALCGREEFNYKAHAGELESRHFICLKAVYNDPLVSFFVMRKDVPHGECSIGEGRPATFYVTEGSSLPLIRSELYRYKLIL